MNAKRMAVFLSVLTVVIAVPLGVILTVRTEPQEWLPERITLDHRPPIPFYPYNRIGWEIEGPSSLFLLSPKCVWAYQGGLFLEEPCDQLLPYKLHNRT